MFVWQSRETVEDAIKILVGDNANQDNLLSYYNGRLKSITASLSSKQHNLTKLGQEGATCEANLRNIRSQLDSKQSELSGKNVPLIFVVIGFFMFEMLVLFVIFMIDKKSSI